MALIQWSKKYAVNVSEVDNQHQKLISLVNQLNDAMRADKGSEALGPVLTELVNYTVYHFKTEERLFRQHGYPQYEAHKRSHDELTQKAKQLKSEYDKGNNLITLDVMLFLSDWLNVHILQEDAKFGPFLNSRGVH